MKIVLMASILSLPLALGPAFGQDPAADKCPASTPSATTGRDASGEALQPGARNASGEALQPGARNASGEAIQPGARNASGEANGDLARNASGSAVAAMNLGPCR